VKYGDRVAAVKKSAGDDREKIEAAAREAKKIHDKADKIFSESELGADVLLERVRAVGGEDGINLAGKLNYLKADARLSCDVIIHYAIRVGNSKSVEEAYSRLEEIKRNMLILGERRDSITEMAKAVAEYEGKMAVEALVARLGCSREIAQRLLVIIGGAESVKPFLGWREQFTLNQEGCEFVRNLLGEYKTLEEALRRAVDLAIKLAENFHSYGSNIHARIVRFYIAAYCLDNCGATLGMKIADGIEV
jgi:hypothetical protein